MGSINCDEAHRGYSEKVKQKCLRMYVNDMGFRGIERVKNINHTTIINQVKKVGTLLPDYYEPETSPQVGELDEKGGCDLREEKIISVTDVMHNKP